MREAFICDGIRTPIGRYGGALSGVRVTIWLLSLCGSCWCETRVSMRNVSMM